MENGVNEQMQRMILTPEEEGTVVPFDKEYCAQAAKEFTNCLVGKIFGSNQVNGEAMIAFFQRKWIDGEKVRFFQVKANTFIIRFPSTACLNRVTNGGPWSFEGQVMVLHDWVLGTDIDSVHFSSLDVWIQVLNLPIHLIKEESGVKAVQAIGEVLNSDQKIYYDKRSNYVRVRARIPIEKPLPRGVFIQTEEGKRWLDFRYERIPRICHWCGRLNHFTGDCEPKIDQDEVPGYGSWLLFQPPICEQEGDNPMTQESSEAPGEGELDGTKNPMIEAQAITEGKNNPKKGVAEMSVKSPLKYSGFEDGNSHVETRYRAELFKQQSTASVEKIFRLVRDNLYKELSPLLSLCIQEPRRQRVHGGKSSPGGVPQQSPSSQWDGIIKFLDSRMSRLREFQVPSLFIRKICTQVFSFINTSLFNSLLLRRECCTFSNGEYVKSGLAELEKWIVSVTEEFAGTSWYELKYIRQAVGFLVIHEKRKMSLEEIMQDLCPALTVHQLYRIITTYSADKYGTQSVSNEVVAQMRESLYKDTQYPTSNSFLFDDDLSIPFSTEDLQILSLKSWSGLLENLQVVV